MGDVLAWAQHSRPSVSGREKGGEEAKDQPASEGSTLIAQVQAKSSHEVRGTLVYAVLG